MKCRILMAGLALFCTIANAQVGTWQVTINRVGGVKETGIGSVTFNFDGTLSGYSLTTLTFGIATYSGTWSIDSHNALIATFTETLNGQTFSGSTGGKLSSKSFAGTVTANGVSYKIKGIPAVGLPDGTGNWVGTVKQGGQTAVESFTAISNTNFPGINDVSGLINGSLVFTGQAAATPKGQLVGYSDTDVNGGILANFTGKLNAVKGTFTIKGIDENGVVLSGKFSRQ